MITNKVLQACIQKNVQINSDTPLSWVVDHSVKIGGRKVRLGRQVRATSKGTIQKKSNRFDHHSGCSQTAKRVVCSQQYISHGENTHDHPLLRKS